MASDVTTPGRLLLAEVLPDDMQDEVRSPMDKKGASGFFYRLATRHPDSYVDTMHRMTGLADKVSTEYGRWTSVRLQDLKLPPRVKAFRELVRARVHAISQNPNWTSDQKSERIVKLVGDNIDKAKELLETEGAAAGNAFALSSKLGIRGNRTQLVQMLFGDMLVTDNSGKTIPLPILRGYAEGLSPLETWAGSYASRRGYCLDAGTHVRMADGTVRAICRVKPGEEVLGCDLEGKLSPVRVLETIDQGKKPVLQFVLTRHGGAPLTISATPEHKVLAHTAAGLAVIPLKDTEAKGTSLRTADGPGSDVVFCGAYFLGLRDVWDLSVDSPSHLFVLANGLVVSNSAVQFSTADTGYLAKQLRLMSTGIQVTDEDCGTTEGMPVDPRGDDAAGRFVASGSGDLKAGTLLTPDNAKKIRQKEILVRSPVTCRIPHGICQKCAGLRPDGKLPGLNSFVTLDAATVMSEPMTQKLALCLDPDTEVRMADWSVKPIKDIVPGDEVLGADSKGGTAPARVLNIVIGRNRYLWRFVFRCGRDNLYLIASRDHKVLALGGPVPVGKLPEDFPVHTAVLGHDAVPSYALFSFGLFSKEGKSVDIEVDNPDHLFVLANGLIVSNSAKHVGGQVGHNEDALSGFDEINQFIQVPENFKGATLTEVDGIVRKIEAAPQGGQYVYVDDEQYHVPVGREITVRKGSPVSAGDPLTDGTMSPTDVARFRGLGEGRRYFVEKFGEILKRNGVGALKPNLELLARAYMQNVRVTDPDGVAGYRFGEVVPYEALQEQWISRPGAKKSPTRYAAGKYLEQPAAHYTIGTRLTPAVMQTLQDRGVSEVNVHDEPPGFQPYVTRAAARSTHEQDFKARLAGYYLKDAYEDMATMGAVDEPDGRPSPFAGIMNPDRLKDVED